MNILVFDSGDEPFFEWMKENPDGLVMNTTSGDGTSYLVFHRSGCHHISGHTKSQPGGAFTERGYIKVCSHEAPELIAWANKNRTEVLNYKLCKTCSPEIELTLAALPEEAEAQKVHVEGAVRTVVINAYERNVLARKVCLEHYGHSCVVCDFNFESAYGKECSKYIHVHHIIPLSEIKGSYEVDPIKDLRPVCPNCHAVIHYGGKTRTIEAVHQMLSDQAGEN